MINLTRFQDNGYEVFIHTLTGESFSSISGAARMLEKPTSTISRYAAKQIKLGAWLPLLEVQIDTEYGVKLHALMSEDQLLDLCFQYNLNLAKQYSKLGIRSHLHTLAGFKITSTAVVPELTPSEAFLEVAKQMVEKERRLKAVEESQLELEKKVDALIEHKEVAESLLFDVPRSDQTPQEISTRGKINMLARKWADANNVLHAKVWESLYFELKYRYGIDIKARAKKKKQSYLDLVEEAGFIDELWAIASEVLI